MPAILYKSSVTNPINSFQTNFGRFYSHPSSGVTDLNVFDGEGPYHPKPSITNIIGMIDKKFLPPYYARLVAEYAVEHLDSIAYQVDKFGTKVAAGSLKNVVNAPNKNAAIGDEIHDAIDQFCNGQDPLTAEGENRLSSLTALRMYEQWLYFAANYPMKIVRSEFTVWSYKHGYAGTGDLMIETADGLGIVDTKSGNNVYPEVALQTSSLSRADVILDANGTESPMPKIDWQGVMHIRPRSIKLYRLDRTDEAFDTFLAAKRIFDWKRFDAPRVMATMPVISQWTKEGS